MQLSESQLRFVLTFRDQATAQMNRCGQAVDRAGQSAGRAEGHMNRLGRTMHTTAGHAGHLRSGLGGVVGMIETLVVGLVAHRGLEVISEFGQRMSTVGAITDATSSQMAAMRSQALMLDVQTRFTATQVAEGMRQLARSGLDANQVMLTVRSTLDLAAAGDIDPNAGTDIMVGALSAFRMTALDASRVADVLAYASKHANTTVQDLGESLKYVGSAAASFGLSIEETAAALGAIARGGMRGSMAGTSLRQVLMGLLGTTSRARNALHELNLETEDIRPNTAHATRVLQDGTVQELRGFEAVLENLHNANMTLDQAAAMFGTRSVTGSLIMMQQMDSFRELMNDMRQTPSDSIQNAISFIGRNAEIAAPQVENLRATLNELMTNDSALVQQASLNGAAGLGMMLENAPDASLRDRIAALGTMTERQMRNVFGPATEQILFILDRFEDVKDQLDGTQSDIDGMARDIAYKINNNLSGALLRLDAAFENFVLGFGQETFGPIRNFIEEVALAIRMTTDNVVHLEAALRDTQAYVKSTMRIDPTQYDFLDNFQGTDEARVRSFLRASDADQVERYNQLMEQGATSTEAMNEIITEARSHMAEYQSALDAATTRIRVFRAAMVGLATVIVGGLVRAFMALLVAIGPVALILGTVAAAYDFVREKAIRTIPGVNEAGEAIEGAGEGIKVTFGDEMMASLDLFWDNIQDFFASMNISVPEFEQLIVDMGRTIGRVLNGLGPWFENAGAQFQAMYLNAQGKREEAAAVMRTAAQTYNAQMDAIDAEIATRANRSAIRRAEHAAEERRAARLAAASGTNLVQGRFENLDATAEDQPDVDAAQAAQDKWETWERSMRARIATVTETRRQQELMNIATALGAQAAMRAAGADREAALAATARGRAAIGLLNDLDAAQDAQRVRSLDSDTAAIQERSRIATTMWGEQAAIANALLEARIQRAQENNVLLGQEPPLTDEVTQAIIRNTQARYAAEHAQMSVMDTIRMNLSVWAEQAKQISGSVGEIMNTAIGGVVDNITAMLSGQQADWKQWGFTIINMILRVIVQMLVMKAVMASLKFFGFETGGVFPSANGNVFSGAQRFANGSAFANKIVNSPTFFRFAKGGSMATGVMGEAGPEAIMPLRRLSNGKLGVEASGMGGGGNNFNTTIAISVEGSTGSPSQDALYMEKVAHVVSKTMDKKLADFALRQSRQGNRLAGAGAFN